MRVIYAMENCKLFIVAATAVLLLGFAACSPESIEEKELEPRMPESAKASEPSQIAPIESPSNAHGVYAPRPGAGGLFYKGDSLVAADQNAAAGPEFAGMNILWLDFGPDVVNFETFWPDEGNGNFVVFPMLKGKNTANPDAMLIDKNGTVVVDRRYFLIRNFSEGLAEANESNKMVYINDKGDVVLADNDDCRLIGGAFSEGLVPVATDSYLGFIDRNGDVVIPARFDDVHGFSEGLAAAKDAESGQWGFIDHSGAYAIPPAYLKEPGDFREGLAFVWNDEEFAFIDTSGNIAIPYRRFSEETLSELKSDPEYIHCSEWPGFFNGIACVDGSYIRKDGSNLDDNLTGYRSFREKVTLAVDSTEGENGAWVCVDTLGKRILPPGLYSPFAWDTVQDGLIPVRDESKDDHQIGMMNEYGHIVVPTMFDFVSEATEGCVLVIPDAEEARIGIFRLPENAAELPLD
jgi:hypothetical protein